MEVRASEPKGDEAMLWMKAKRGIQHLNLYVSVVGMFLLIPLMLLTTGDVMSRVFFNKPIPGIVEISEYMLATLILLGIAYTQQVKGHVGVSFFVSRLSPRGQTACQMITTLFSMFIFTIVVWEGLIVGIEERTVSDMLRIPQYPFRLLVALGGFLLWLELLIDLIDLIGKIKRRA
jgi:TRAP-type C4-dicarboxylate transport system permease small subunit